MINSNQPKVLTLNPKNVAIAPPKEWPTTQTWYPWHSDPGANKDDRNPVFLDSKESETP